MSEVKYVVSPLERSVIVQIYVPIARAALSPEHGERLDRACQAARQVLADERDAIAIELRMRGVCPWCNDLSHPEGGRCLGPMA